MTRLRLAVLVSGTGRSLLNLLEREQAGCLPVKTVLVISSRAGVAALDHAAAFHIPALVRTPDAISAALDEVQPGLIVMAGFTRRWPLPARYLGCTINIHPALLPRFGGQGLYGRKVHDAVLASDARESGCTVHYVTEDYDAGPIIAQERVPVLPDDDARSLAQRVFARELELLPRVITEIARGRMSLLNGKVELQP